MLQKLLFIAIGALLLTLACTQAFALDHTNEAPTLESAARNFVIPKRNCRSVQFDSMTVAGLDSMGWSGLVPSHTDDTSVIVRVSFMEIEGELRIPVAGTSPGKRPEVPVSPSVHAFIRASDLQPLFAVTGRYWDISREVVPMGLDSILNIVKRQASLELSTPKDLLNAIPKGGVNDNALVGRSVLTVVDLAVIHLMETRINGILVPVWLITSYGRSSTPLRGHLEECDTSLEVALAISDEGLRGNTVLKWDGFPNHPEHFRLVDECMERFLQYQQQRQQWLNEREQKKE